MLTKKITKNIVVIVRGLTNEVHLSCSRYYHITNYILVKELSQCIFNDVTLL